MIAPHYRAMLGAKSVIREISEWSTARGKEIGYDNVFDYSLGNPSVPCPDAFTAACKDLLDTVDPVTLHGYTPTLTLPEVRAAVAESLNRRFGMDYTAAHIFMTSGAAGALAHALRCVAVPGQNIVTFAPFFPEYKPYVEGAGLTLRVAPPRVEDFQIDLEALNALVDENTAALLINSPNNPSGVAYSAGTLARLAAWLAAASQRFGHHIFLISDEPYREIAFGGTEIPYPAKFYDDTLTCYSFSKSLSVPGERIGYLAANPRCEGADLIVPICGQISRGTGHNCPSGLFQRAVAAMGDSPDKEGVALIQKQLQSVLEQSGLTLIEALGEDFDPNIHEAVMQTDAGEENRGKVVMEIQKGYMLNGKLLRASMVQVGS